LHPRRSHQTISSHVTVSCREKFLGVVVAPFYREKSGSVMAAPSFLTSPRRVVLWKDENPTASTFSSLLFSSLSSGFTKSSSSTTTTTTTTHRPPPASSPLCCPCHDNGAFQRQHRNDLPCRCRCRGRVVPIVPDVAESAPSSARDGLGGKFLSSCTLCSSNKRGKIMSGSCFLWNVIQLVLILAWV
jgi:hypothetical protein